MDTEDFQIVEILDFKAGAVWGGRDRYASIRLTVKAGFEVMELTSPYYAGQFEELAEHLGLPDPNSLDELQKLCRLEAAKGKIPPNVLHTIEGLGPEKMPRLVAFSAKNYPPVSPLAVFLTQASPLQLLHYFLEQGNAAPVVPKKNDCACLKPG